MIRPFDRKLVALLVRLGVWRCQRGLFGSVQLVMPRGTRWLYRLMRDRQTPEDRPYHHAPACPANRWAGQALVFQPCNCGAFKREIICNYPTEAACDCREGARIGLEAALATPIPAAPPPPPDWNDIRGLAPRATGSLSSEDFVRETRDEWDAASNPTEAV